MLATGLLSIDTIPKNRIDLDSIYGIEFSGRNSKGQRVMGIVPAVGLATTVLSDMLWEVPNKWTLKEAATIPIAYCTAYLALFIRGQMKSGESILIHTGSGGVGLASISIALHAGCTVFTTVGNQEKRDFIKKIFPQISDK